MIASVGETSNNKATELGGESADSDCARLIPVGGGKGGVGKSFVVANLAASLARAGQRVVAVDGDLEGAHLHTCVGVAKPPQPSHSRRLRLMRSLRNLPVDFVLLDLGAGTHSAVMDYFMIGENGVVVVAPEPTSVENAYAFIRAAFYRRLRLAMASHDMRKIVTLAMDQRNELGIRTPLDLLREIQALDPDEGGRFVDTMRAFRPRLVINDVRTADDIKLGFSIQSVCRKYFGIETEYLGYVNHDRAARRSVYSRRPLIEAYPRSDAAIYLSRIALKLLDDGPTRAISRSSA